MKPLPHPNNQHLDAAEGWLGLGNVEEAKEELKKIDPRYRAHPAVVEMRYKIYSEAKEWELALEAARELREILPQNPWGHFYSAYALHEMKRTREAYEVVKAVIHKFPKHQFMHFNLACYACQLGQLNEALGWLKQAIEVEGEIDMQKLALEDPDLEPLWGKIGEI